MGRLGRRGRDHPGLRHGHQRRPGWDDRSSRSTPRDHLPARHLSHRVLRRKRRAQSGDGDPFRAASPGPTRLPDPTPTGLVDCGNWAVSASWRVPANRRLRHLPRAAGPHRHRRRQPRRLHRPPRRREIRRPLPDRRTPPGRPTTDTAGTASIRARGRAAVSGVGRAYKVSYNRPIHRARIRRRGLLLQRRVPDGPLAGAERVRRQLLHGHRRRPPGRRRSPGTRSSCPSGTTNTGPSSSGSTWKPRATAVPGQTAPVHLALFSGNDVSGRRGGSPASALPRPPHRTLVCYKETHEGAKIDPSPEWTGTWRDPRPLQSRGREPGKRPHRHHLHRQLLRRAARAFRLPDSQMRFWRNTPNVSQLTGTQVWTGPAETIGYEWNEDLDNGVRPPGLVRLSTTTLTSPRASSTTARRTAPERPPIPSPSTSVRAARSCSAPAPSSGRGASTATTIAAAVRRARTCSRRRSTSSPTWASSRRRSIPSSCPRPRPRTSWPRRHRSLLPPTTRSCRCRCR